MTCLTGWIAWGCSKQTHTGEDFKEEETVAQEEQADVAEVTAFIQLQLETSGHCLT